MKSTDLTRPDWRSAYKRSPAYEQLLRTQAQERTALARRQAQERAGARIANRRKPVSPGRKS